MFPESITWRIPGISGDVDLDYSYEDFPKIITKGGFNGCPQSGSDQKSEKTVDELAREVLQGLWGNGATRRKKLTGAGYDYTRVQKRVNELLK